MSHCGSMEFPISHDHDHEVWYTGWDSTLMWVSGVYIRVVYSVDNALDNIVCVGFDVLAMADASNVLTQANYSMALPGNAQEYSMPTQCVAE